jgi:hypothetical protein
MEEKTMNYVVVKKSDLDALLGYVDTLMDFIDVDEFEDEENVDAVNYGYDNFVEPLRSTSKLKTPDAFVKDEEIETFKETLEDVYGILVSEIPNKKIREVYEKYCEKMSIEASCHEEGVIEELIGDFSLPCAEAETV